MMIGLSLTVCTRVIVLIDRQTDRHRNTHTRTDTTENKYTVATWVVNSVNHIITLLLLLVYLRSDHK